MNGRTTMAWKTTARRGNMLFGCLAVLGLIVVIGIIALVWVANSWRGWMAGGIEQTLTAVLTEAEMEEGERIEIMAHVETLMDRFRAEDVTLEELGRVVERLAESPLVPAALVMAFDELYVNGSELPEEEKAQARIELARLAQGLYEETIEPTAVQEVLEPISTTTPDHNDIDLDIDFGEEGKRIEALRSADEVSLEDLRTVIAAAKAKADEAGVSETPIEIDLSDEVAVAIANALGEDPSLWLPPGADVITEPVVDDETVAEPIGEEPTTIDEPVDVPEDDEGP